MTKKTNYKKFLEGKSYKKESLIRYFLQEKKLCLLEDKDYFLKTKEQILASENFAKLEKTKIYLSEGICLLECKKIIIGIEKKIENLKIQKIKTLKIKFVKLFIEVRKIRQEFNELNFMIKKDIKIEVRKIKNKKYFLDYFLDLIQNPFFIKAIEKNKNSLQNYFASEPDEKSQYGSKYYNKNLKLYYLNNNQILNLEFDKIRLSDHKSGINFNNYERIYKTIDDIKIGLPQRIVENQTAFSGKQKGWSLKYEPIGLDFVINNNNEHTILENIDKITAILTINLN